MLAVRTEAGNLAKALQLVVEPSLSGHLQSSVPPGPHVPLSVTESPAFGFSSAFHVRLQPGSSVACVESPLPASGDSHPKSWVTIFCLPPPEHQLGAECQD